MSLPSVLWGWAPVRNEATHLAWSPGPSPKARPPLSVNPLNTVTADLWPSIGSRIEGRAPTAVVPLLQKAGVKTCVYGHLHGKDHKLGLRGLHEGIRFVLAASDYIDFAPIEIPVDA